MKTLLKGLIHLYRFLISPLTGAKCRFYPTCSAYAVEAIDVHGAGKGSIMAVKRILQCHPWHKGPMIDPVPASIDWRGVLGYKRASNGCGCSAHSTKDQN